MPRAVRFYCALGFEVLRGNEQSSFTTFRGGMSYLNFVASLLAALVVVGARTSQFHSEAHGQWNFLIGLLLRPWPTLNEILWRVRLGPLGSAALLMLQGAGKAIHKDRRDAAEDNGQMWVTTRLCNTRLDHKSPWPKWSMAQRQTCVVHTWTQYAR